MARAPLAVDYLGLALRSPLVPAASPLTLRLDNLRAMEDAGAGAVVLGSLFEERIRNAAVAPYVAMDHAETWACTGMSDGWSLSPHEYIEFVAKAKQALGIPVIASLNSSGIGHWVQYADLVEKAGADALELNLHLLPTDPATTGGRIERDYLDIVESVRMATALPLAVKIPPFFSSLPSMVKALQDAGAGGVVLFQRGYQPEVDLVTRTMRPRWPLSQPHDEAIALRWMLLLHGNVSLDLAASGGIHCVQDVLSSVAVGAKVTMLCSALFMRGIDHIRALDQGVRDWLEQNGVESLDALRGTVRMGLVHDPGSAERANYLAALHSMHRRPIGGQFNWSCLP
jgi:dihydroorotate dehydrogenase (fumarate)